MPYRTWLLVFALGLTPLSLQSQEQTQSAQSPATEQQGQPEDPPFSIPFRIIESNEASIARQREEAETRQREIDDLVAQQGMNEATQSMMRAAWVSTGLVGLGTFLLIWTLRLTRQAGRAAEEAVAVTRKIGEAQVKAYLSIESVSLSIYDAAEWPVVEVVVKNSGQSPATNLEIKVRFDFWMRADGQKSAPEHSPALMLASDVSANSTVVAGPTIFQGEYFDSSFFKSGLEDLVGAKIDVVVYAESVFEKEITTYGSFMAPWRVSGDKHSSIAMKRIDSNHFKDGTVDDLRSEHRKKKG